MFTFHMIEQNWAKPMWETKYEFNKPTNKGITQMEETRKQLVDKFDTALDLMPDKRYELLDKFYEIVYNMGMLDALAVNKQKVCDMCEPYQQDDAQC